MQSTLGIAGIATTILIAISSWFVSATGGIAAEVKDIRADVSDKGERISSLETNFKNVDKTLDSINKKLDTLISANSVKK